MADGNMASVQFKDAPASGMQHRMGVEIGQEAEHESPVSLSSKNISSADAATAWRVRRSGKPLPYSRRTMGSLYDFSQE